jgi:hypothetical protein
MEKINQIIDWSEIEVVILRHYAVGTTLKGTYAYHPLLLIKCILSILSAPTPQILTTSCRIVSPCQVLSLSSPYFLFALKKPFSLHNLVLFLHDDRPDIAPI